MKKTELKIAVLLGILLFITGISEAQIMLGVKAGITSTSVKVNEVIQDANNIDALKVEGQNASVGFQGGLFGRIALFGVYVQPELLFSSTSSEVKVTDLSLPKTDADYEKIKSQEFKKIDIPIMAGIKLGPARLQAGPIASIVIDSKSALTDYGSYEEQFKGATWGYQAGVGVDLFKKIVIDAKYEGNLSKLGKGVTIGGETREFDSRTNQFVLGVGFVFRVIRIVLF